MAAPAALATIGWREYVRLPGLGIGPLMAKVDTGARTAALHAVNIAIQGDGDGRSVQFDAVIDEGSQAIRRCVLALHGVKRVKNSSGATEERCVVETELEIAAWRWSVLVTLTDRGDMGVPMLIGRSAVKGRFMVDPGQSFLLSAPPQPDRKARP
ncbi:MAG: ATP-dependent zinc protease [Hyphomicrobiales bacterium]